MVSENGTLTCGPWTDMARFQLMSTRARQRSARDDCGDTRRKTTARFSGGDFDLERRMPQHHHFKDTPPTTISSTKHFDVAHRPSSQVKLQGQPHLV